MNLIAKEFPTSQEATVILIFGFGIALLFGYSDIVIHDYYVKPDVEECFPENQSEHCMKLRQLHGLPSDAQIDIGNKYWEVFKIQIYALATIFFFFKLFIFVGIRGWKHLDGNVLLTALLYGITVSGFIFFGWVDFFYYQLRPDITFPNELPWLNDSGIFTATKWFGEDPNTVERGDLLATNILGSLLLVIAWVLLIRYVKKTESKIKKYV